MTSREGRSRHVLVLTADVLTAKMAGPAIRAWHIAHYLARQHEVILATTSGQCTRSSEQVTLLAPEREEFGRLEAWCDVLVFQGYVFEQVPELRETQKLVVVDLYTPLHLETLALSEGNALPARQAQNGLILAELNRQLVRGDFFICANDRQRDLWIGQLSALGRINPLTWDDDPSLGRLIATVPFGLPDEEPEKTRFVLRGVVDGIGEDDEIVIWGGGVYNWFDPLTLIRAIDLLRRDRPKIRLFFLGLSHPNPEVPEMSIATATARLADELELTGQHVFFNDGWVEYEERQNFLLEADLAVSTHPVNAETRFSFRTRMLDYLWAGLPIVTTVGDGFAELVERENLGSVVSPGDPEALAAAIRRLLETDGSAETARRNVGRVREAYRWNAVLQPLAQFCWSGERAPDRYPPEHWETSRAEHEVPLRGMQPEDGGAASSRAEQWLGELAQVSAAGSRRVATAWRRLGRALTGGGIRRR